MVIAPTWGLADHEALELEDNWGASMVGVGNHDVGLAVAADVLEASHRACLGVLSLSFVFSEDGCGLSHWIPISHAMISIVNDTIINLHRKWASRRSTVLSPVLWRTTVITRLTLFPRALMILLVEELLFPLLPIKARGDRRSLERRCPICWGEIGIHLAKPTS